MNNTGVCCGIKSFENRQKNIGFNGFDNNTSSIKNGEHDSDLIKFSRNIASDKSKSNNNNLNTVNIKDIRDGNSKKCTKNVVLKGRICRNFSKGLCKRKHCRYPHVFAAEQVVFCHDFQNSNCSRVNCKFLHYTLEEEEYYRKFGEFSHNYIMCERDQVHQFFQSQNILKDFISCGICRHRHCYLHSQTRDITKESFFWNDHHFNYRRNYDRLIPNYRNDDFKPVKRSSQESCESNGQYKRYREESERFVDIMTIIRSFEEDQLMLRRRVEANEIKIAELRATNEYLMAQSAHLRINNQVQQHQPRVQVQQQSQQCSTVVNPVTGSQTTTQPQTQVISGSVSIAPVQVQATPIVSIATPQTQIITNADGTPLTIATANASQGQQLAAIQQNINSLSNNTQNISQATQQILGTSQITLTPALAQGASMGLTINTSQALAMSNATQSNISYPVMTHSILPHCNN